MNMASITRWFSGQEELPVEDGSVILENRTARKIAITERSGKGDYLLGAFETLTLKPEDLDRLDTGEWLRRNLIRLHGPEVAARPARINRLLMVLAALVVAVGLSREPGLARTLILGAGGVLAAGALAVQLRALLRAAISSLTFLLVGLVGFGMSAAPLVLWFQVTDLSGPGQGQNLFLRTLWWLFTGLASVLPATLYFLFARIKLRALRQSFLRDIVRMNPSIETVDDAENLYGARVDELYGQQDSPLGTHLPLIISTLLLTLGWLTVAPPSGLVGAAGDTSLLPKVTVTSTGFLGAYFFILQMLFRRYVRSDLGPKAYTHVSLRLLSTAVLVWMLGLLPASEAGAGAATGMLILAFLTGIVPDTAFVVLQDFLRSTRIFQGRIHALTEQCPLTDLEGITLYDRARFLEEGVENVENLAHHSLIDLMLWTRLPTARLVDLVDQSILYLHVVNPHVANASAGEGERPPTDDLTRLRRYGLRTATDLLRAHEQARKEGAETAGALLGLLGEEVARVPRLKVILDAMEDDDWLNWLRHWHQRARLAQTVHQLEDFSRWRDRAPAPERPEAALVPVPAMAAASEPASMEPLAAKVA